MSQGMEFHTYTVCKYAIDSLRCDKSATNHKHEHE